MTPNHTLFTLSNQDIRTVLCIKQGNYLYCKDTKWVQISPTATNSFQRYNYVMMMCYVSQCAILCNYMIYVLYVYKLSIYILMSCVYSMVMLYVLSFKIYWHIFQLTMMFKEIKISASIMLLYLFKHIHEHYILLCSPNIKMMLIYF